MRHYAATLFIGIGLATASHAETLQDAWAVALQADQRLAAAHAQRESAEFSVRGAKAARLPSIAFTMNATQLDDAPRFAFGDSFLSPDIFSGGSFGSASTQVQLPLFTSGATAHNIAAAVSELDAVTMRAEIVAQDTKLKVAEAYVRVLRSERALTVAQSNAMSLAAHTQDAKNRFDLGAVPKNDFLSASVSLADARQRELQAVNALDVAMAVYNRQLGRSLTEPVRLDPTVSDPVAVIADNTIEALIDIALRSRHELDALSAQSAAFRQQSSAVRAQSRPQLALTGGYTYFENDFLDEEQFWWVGVGLSWNLFDSGRTRNRAAAAASQAAALSRQRRDLESVIALQVRQAWLEWQEADRRTAVTLAAVEQSAENLRVARDRYKAGAGTNTEVLDAQAMRALSLNNRDNAVFDTALARLRLARAVGNL